jgi:hypothetical protein
MVRRAKSLRSQLQQSVRTAITGHLSPSNLDVIGRIKSYLHCPLIPVWRIKGQPYSHIIFLSITFLEIRRDRNLYHTLLSSSNFSNNNQFIGPAYIRP